MTVNVYRPGGVDTAMQAWIREQDPDRIGTALHARFNRSFADGHLITPEQSAAALIGHLGGDDTGAIWDVSRRPSSGHEPVARNTRLSATGSPSSAAQPQGISATAASRPRKSSPQGSHAARWAATPG